MLDCFAGSGALGFEALSRGAAGLVAIERQRTAVAALRTTAERLQCTDVEIDAVFVFIDPPYARPELRRQVFERLEARNCLNPGAMIYFEWPDSETFDLPSSALQWVRQKSAGQVHYAIAEWRRSR